MHHIHSQRERRADRPPLHPVTLDCLSKGERSRLCCSCSCSVQHELSDRLDAHACVSVSACVQVCAKSKEEDSGCEGECVCVSDGWWPELDDESRWEERSEKLPNVSFTGSLACLFSLSPSLLLSCCCLSSSLLALSLPRSLSLSTDACDCEGEGIAISFSPSLTHHPLLARPSCRTVLCSESSKSVPHSLSSSLVSLVSLPKNEKVKVRRLRQPSAIRPPAPVSLPPQSSK